MPLAVVTVSLALTAPAGATKGRGGGAAAAIATGNEPSFSAVASSRFVPSTFTESPAWTGESKLVILGVTLKVAALTAGVLPAVDTVTWPVVAPGGTATLISVADTTRGDGADVPWNLTTLLRSNPDPPIDTTVPTGPVAGLSETSLGLTR